HIVSECATWTDIISCQIGSYVTLDNTSDIFRAKGVNKLGTNWFNVVIECHFNRGTTYDNCQRHPEADARARSTAAEVPGHVVRHHPRAARPRQLPQLESLLRLL